MVLDQHAGVGAQLRIGVDDRISQAAVELCIGFAGIQLAQHHLAVGPGQFEHAIGQMAIMEFLDQANTGFAGVSHAGDDVDDHRLLGLKRDLLADRGDRVEYRAGTVR